MRTWFQRSFWAWVGVLVCLALLTSIAFAAAGDLDTTFNTPDGFIVTDADTSDPQSVSGVVIQSDGKIVVGGGATTDYQTGDAYLARYDGNGALDTSFGTDGIAHFAAGPAWTRSGALAVQPDDKLIMGGFYYVKDGHAPGVDSRTPYLARFCPDGQLDDGANCGGSGFGAGGVVNFEYQDSEVTGELSAILVQSDGKIVAGGYSALGNPQHLALARFCSDGSWDDGSNCGAGGFGSGGRQVFVYDPASDQEQIYAMLELSDGKLLIGGFSADADWIPRFLVMRLESNGAPDAAFGTNGGVVTLTEPNVSNATIRGLAMQSDGKIIAAGYSADDVTWKQKFATVRYTTAGVLDTTFGSSGVVLTQINYFGDTYPTDSGYAVYVQPDDKIVVGGEAMNEDYNATAMALVRYCANGQLDDGSNCGAGGFSGDGILAYQPAGGTEPNISRLAFQDSTKMLVTAGRMKVSGKSNVLVARFDLGLAAAEVAISGNAGLPGVSLGYTDDGPQTVSADGSGVYSITVPSGWSGTVTPSLSGYTFSPASRDYTEVSSDQSDQNYSVASCSAGPGPHMWSTTFANCPSGARHIIGDGALVIMDVDVDLQGDLELQGTGALDASGSQKTLTLSGGAAQTLTGNPLSFYRLVINKTNKTDTVTIDGKLRVTKKLTLTRGRLVSASDYENIEIAVDGELQLTSPITVSGHFTNTGVLTTDSYSVTFDGRVEQNLVLNVVTSFDDLNVASGTTLVEMIGDDNALVLGTLTNNGVIRKTQPIVSATQYYFGLAGRYNGADLEIDITALGVDFPPNEIQVEHVAGDHSGRTGSAGHGVGWGHYWSIIPDDTDFSANVTLPHDVAPSSNAQACQYVEGSIWECQQDAVSADTVTYSGVTPSTDWAAGDQVGPTAVSVRRFESQASANPQGWLNPLWFAICAGLVASLVFPWRSITHLRSWSSWSWKRGPARR